MEDEAARARQGQRMTGVPKGAPPAPDLSTSSSNQTLLSPRRLESIHQAKGARLPEQSSARVRVWSDPAGNKRGSGMWLRVSCLAGGPVDRSAWASPQHGARPTIHRLPNLTPPSAQPTKPHSEASKVLSSLLIYARRDVHVRRRGRSFRRAGETQEGGRRLVSSRTFG